MRNVKFIKEKKLIGGFFDEIAQDTGKYCFGIQDTMRALDMGAIETFIMYEDLPVNRIVVKQASDGVENTFFLTAEQEKNMENLYKDKESGAENELVDKRPLTEWIVENYMNFGAKLEFVTDKSSEGSQFARGFGGIGAMLRYRVEFENFEADAGGGDSDSSDFM